MPVTTPIVKIEATQAHGATVVLDGETLAEAQAQGRGDRARARPDLGPSL